MCSIFERYKFNRFTLFLSRAQKSDQIMVSGNQIRLNRILRKGRMLCIPMDHGISNGPIEGLEESNINNLQM